MDYGLIWTAIYPCWTIKVPLLILFYYTQLKQFDIFVIFVIRYEERILDGVKERILDGVNF